MLLIYLLLLLHLLLLCHPGGGRCCRECAAHGRGAQQQRQHGQQPVGRVDTHPIQRPGRSQHGNVMCNKRCVMCDACMCVCDACMTRGAVCLSLPSIRAATVVVMLLLLCPVCDVAFSQPLPSRFFPQLVCRPPPGSLAAGVPSSAAACPCVPWVAWSHFPWSRMPFGHSPCPQQGISSFSTLLFGPSSHHTVLYPPFSLTHVTCSFCCSAATLQSFLWCAWWEHVSIHACRVFPGCSWHWVV